MKMIESDENSDEKAIAAMGLLTTIDTLLSVMENNLDIMKQLQPIVLQVVGEIFTQRVTEFYEEALSLVYALTSKTISPEMWQVLELMYKVTVCNVSLQILALANCVRQLTAGEKFLNNGNKFLIVLQVSGIKIS